MINNIFSIKISPDGFIIIQDETSFDNSSVAEHVLVDRFINYKGEEVFPVQVHVISDDSYKTRIYKVPQDGVLTYQAMELCIVSDHTHSGYYYDKDSGFIKDSENKVVTFEDAYNAFSSIPKYLVEGQEASIFSFYYLIRCFIAMEEERVNSLLKGCRKQCKDVYSNPDADLLNSAIYLLEYFVELKDYERAEEILEKISACGGLCKDLKHKSCNCG